MVKPTPDNFDPLRRLLAWKHHEQPPPGFFLGFSRKVMARIAAEQRATPTSWWQAWAARFDPRPVLIGAYTVAVCGLLLLGISLSQVFSEKPPQAQLGGGLLTDAPMAIGLASDTAIRNFLSSEAIPLSSMVNPVFNNEPPPFLFRNPSLRTQPADFRLFEK